MRATEAALAAVFTDVQTGLRETVGVECALHFDDRCSAILHLPDESDAAKIARAIDLENVEAWQDETGAVHLALSPWLSTKDVDQTVLSAVKVIHVLLGIHASDNLAPPTLKEKIFGAVAEIMNIQKKIEKR